MTSAHSVIGALGFYNGERRGTPLWLPAAPLAAQTSSCRTAGRVENSGGGAPTGLRYPQVYATRQKKSTPRSKETFVKQLQA